MAKHHQKNELGGRNYNANLAVPTTNGTGYSRDWAIRLKYWLKCKGVSKHKQLSQKQQEQFNRIASMIHEQRIIEASADFICAICNVAFPKPEYADYWRKTKRNLLAVCDCCEKKHYPYE